MRAVGSGVILMIAIACSTGVGRGQSSLAGGTTGSGATQQQEATVDQRSEKQKALALQAQMLVDMASELKIQVDKTNRNILSLTVVRKAEQIEALARRMKEQAKK